MARTWGRSHHQSSREPNRNALLPGFLLPVLPRTQVSIQPLLLPSSLPHLSQTSIAGISFSLPSYSIFPQPSSPGVSFSLPPYPIFSQPSVQGSPSPCLPTPSSPSPLVQGLPVHTLVFPSFVFPFVLPIFLPVFFPYLPYSWINFSWFHPPNRLTCTQIFVPRSVSGNT